MEPVFLWANIANIVVQLLLVVTVTLAALRWGGPATRIAALFNAVIWPATTAFGLLPIPETPAMWVTCSLDLIAGAGFLYAAARHNSLWISVAVLAQGVQTAIDVIYIGEGSSFDRIHHFMLGATQNVFTYAIQAGILGAALADRRRLALQPSVRV